MPSSGPLQSLHLLGGKEAENFQRENLAIAPCLSSVTVSSSFMVVPCLLPGLAHHASCSSSRSSPDMLFTPPQHLHSLPTSQHVSTACYAQDARILHSVNGKGTLSGPVQPLCQEDLRSCQPGRAFLKKDAHLDSTPSTMALAWLWVIHPERDR